MFCKQCGQKIEGSVKFCPSCGAAQQIVSANDSVDIEALKRRAEKIIREFNQYPLMPRSDSFQVIQKVFEYDPLFVLKDLKRKVMNSLLEASNYRYSEQDLAPLIDEIYKKYERGHIERIRDILKDNMLQDARGYMYESSYYMDMRPVESSILYYAFSFFTIGKVLGEEYNYVIALTELNLLNHIQCRADSGIASMGFSRSGKMLSLEEFNEDRKIYMKMKEAIVEAASASGNTAVIEKIEELEKAGNTETGGCYIATCVYGSYDCPQVWVLRRFRDDYLQKRRLGQLFVRFYYRYSPGMVHRFGKSEWFRRFWIKSLDMLVNKLKEKGVSETPYADR